MPNPVHSLDNRHKDYVSSNPAKYPYTQREVSNPLRQPVHSRISLQSISSHLSRQSSCGTNSSTFSATSLTRNPFFGDFQRGSQGDSSSKPNQKSLDCNPLATTIYLGGDPPASESGRSSNSSFQPKIAYAPEFGSAFTNPGSSVSGFPHLPARASIEAPSSSTRQAGSNSRPAQPHDFFSFPLMMPMISPIRSPPSTRGVGVAISDNVCREADVSAGGAAPPTPVATHEHHSVGEFRDMWDQMLIKPTPPITGYQGR